MIYSYKNCRSYEPITTGEIERFASGLTRDANGNLVPAYATRFKLKPELEVYRAECDSPGIFEIPTASAALGIASAVTGGVPVATPPPPPPVPSVAAPPIPSAPAAIPAAPVAPPSSNGGSPMAGMTPVNTVNAPTAQFLGLDTLWDIGKGIVNVGKKVFGGSDPVIPTGGTDFGPSTSCFPPYFYNPQTRKCELDLVPGPGGGGTGPNRTPTTNGRRIAPSTASGFQPMARTMTVHRCGKGSVLGDDGLCYDKRTIPNSRRMWPKARKPLGTPGELAAVAKASRFARRLKQNEKRIKRAGRALNPR